MNAGYKPPGDDVETKASPRYDEDMNRRVTRLEVIIETVLPTLATKAKLAELRAEINARFSALQAEMHAGDAALRAEFKAELAKHTQNIQRWMITTAIALFFGLGGLMIALTSLTRQV